MLPNNDHRNLFSLTDDEEGYSHNETTIDPGNTLFIIAVFICISSLLALPLTIRLGKYIQNCKKQRRHGGDTNAGSGSEDPGEETNRNNDRQGALAENNNVEQSQEDSTNLSLFQRCRKTSYDNLVHILEHVVQWRKHGASHNESADWRREQVARGMAREARESMVRHQLEGHHNNQQQKTPSMRVLPLAALGGTVELSLHQTTVIPEEETPDLEQKGTQETQKTTPAPEVGGSDQKEEKTTDNIENGQLGIHDPENMIIPHRRRRRRFRGPFTGKFIRNTKKLMWSITKYDNETKRLLRLAVPFTFSAVFLTMSDLVILAIISHTLGTDAMTAYAMVDILCGISSEFMGGWVEAISSLGSMAFGARNYELVGLYVQTSCIGYIICEIPALFIWGATIGPILTWMELPVGAVELAEAYVWVHVPINMMKGINEGVLDFLEVIEYEAYANIMFCLSSLAKVGLVALVSTKMDTTLVVLGLVMLVNEALFFFLNVFIPSKMGWLTKFEIGLFGHCACRQYRVVKELASVALPLAIGNMLNYAEWEILTVFAAILGPAEAATWAVLGFVWDVFESTTEAIGDAGEVRCSYQLGKGRPALARLSAYKSIFLSTILATLVTAIFLSLSNVLPSWLTTDETIQSMLSDLFPLMALGNMTMNVGMVCWALVGAQGRYQLATTVAMGCSFLITLPLAAVLTIGMNIDLQGLTFSVVIGYAVTAMILSTFLLMSDWETISTAIQERMAREEEEESDSDDDSSLSSSSSSSSDGEERQPISHSIGVGYFEVSPTSPGASASPHTPRSPNDIYAHFLTTPQPENTSYSPNNRAASMPYLASYNASPTRTPESEIELTPNPSSTPSSFHSSPPRTPTRKQSSMTPEHKKVKSLAKLRSLGSQLVEEGSLPSPPSSPEASLTPNSIGTWHPTTGQEVGFARPSSNSLPPPMDGYNKSPSRGVKGRRARIR